MPMTLLCAASRRLGGPEKPFQVRDILVDLRGLVVRDDPGTSSEHVGLFHQTLAEYLVSVDAESFRIDLAAAHRAILDGIDELLPVGSPVDQISTNRYAVIKEVDHLWALGEYELVEVSLLQRKPSNKAESVSRHSVWRNRLQSNYSEHKQINLIRKITPILIDVDTTIGGSHRV